MDMLKKIAESMGDVCKKTGVQIITGDTKVAEKGSVDGVFINTSGIGIISEHYHPKAIIDNDKIIITGGIAEHGTTIAVERYNIYAGQNIQSDCMPLNIIVEKLQKNLKSIKLMKDPTRGGLATALNEIAQKSKIGITIFEDAIPIKCEIKSIDDMLGLDPLYLACEGRMIIVVEEQESLNLLRDIKCLPGCEDAAIIGSFSKKEKNNNVLMETEIGGKRLIDSLELSMLPRICW